MGTWAEFSPHGFQSEEFRFNYVFKIRLKLLFSLMYFLSQASGLPREGEFALSHGGHGGSLSS